jgi:pimeloyl-ACP methyl ester carboxylesterase
MVMGLGLQLIHWDPDFCTALADRGFHVIIFDNRDTGLSSKIEGGPKANLWVGLLGRSGSASYRLEDMADDTAGLLDALEVEQAHVLGASLGGMIAQTLALNHPERVLSLASVMSTTGNRRIGFPRLSALRVLLRPAPSDREKYIEFFVRAHRAIGSPAFRLSEAEMRELAAAGYDRSFCPAGTVRQLLAIVASGDRTKALRGLEVPTVVIHGQEDPMVPPRAGRATARAIPGAELVEIPGMGHDLPRQVWASVIDAVVGNTTRAAQDSQKPAASLTV